jgi:hypothetical protein
MKVIRLIQLYLALAVISSAFLALARILLGFNYSLSHEFILSLASAAIVMVIMTSRKYR